MTLITGSFLLDAIIFLATITYGFYLYLTWNFDYWKKRNVPYLTPSVIVGNFSDVFLLKAQMGIYISTLYEKAKSKYLGIYIFRTPQIIIRDPEMIKNVLVKDFNVFADRNIVGDEKVDPIVANVLFAMKMPHWRNMRNKLSPIFTSGKIKSMVPLISEAADGLVEYLNSQSLKSDSLEAKGISAQYTIEVISSCAFGIKANCYDDEKSPFRVMGREMFEFTASNAFRQISYFFAPGLVSFLKLKFFKEKVYDFSRQAFLSTIKMREESKTKRNDLIDILIELRKSGDNDGIDFTGDRVVAQPLQFFAAGFETTSSTMSFMLYELACHPEYQNRLRVEIGEVLEKHNGKINYDSIREMPYLEQVFKETLRRYPILAFLDRRCLETYKMPNDDLVIEEGTPVYIPVYGLHHDPKYFPNPEEFDPERFSSTNINKIVPYSYLPFGQGPHNCIGERFAYVSTKLGIVNVLSNFFVEVNEETPSKITFDPRGMVLQSDVGIPLRFVPINRKLSRVG